MLSTTASPVTRTHLTDSGMVSHSEENKENSVSVNRAQANAPAPPLMLKGVTVPTKKLSRRQLENASAPDLLSYIEAEQQLPVRRTGHKTLPIAKPPDLPAAPPLLSSSQTHRRQPVEQSDTHQNIGGPSHRVGAGSSGTAFTLRQILSASAAAPVTSTSVRPHPVGGSSPPSLPFPSAADSSTDSAAAATAREYMRDLAKEKARLLHELQR